METNIFKNMLKLSGGTTITQIMGIVVLPILSRVYSPENFGFYALFFSISNILLVISAWQYDAAIVIPKDYDESLNLFFLSIILLTIMSLFFLIILTLFNKIILDLFRLENFPFVFFFIPIHIFISGLYQILRSLNSKNNAFGNSAKSSIINSGLTYLCQIIIGISFLKEFGLIYGSIIGSFVATVFLLSISFKYISIKSINSKKIKKSFYKYKKFPIFTAPGNFLGVLGSQLPVIQLSSFFGTTYSGFYSLSNKAINIPSRIIASSISEVSYKHTSDIIDNSKLLSSYIEKSVAMIFQISFIPFLIVLLFGKMLINLFLGEQWITAGVYIQILSPLVFLELLNSPINILKQKNRNDLFFKWQLLYLLSSFFGLSLGFIFKSPTLSILTFSFLVSLCQIIIMYLNFRLADASFRKMFYNFRNTFYLKKLIKGI